MSMSIAGDAGDGSGSISMSDTQLPNPFVKYITNTFLDFFYTESVKGIRFTIQNRGLSNHAPFLAGKHCSQLCVVGDQAVSRVCVVGGRLGKNCGRI